MMPESTAQLTGGPAHAPAASDRRVGPSMFASMPSGARVLTAAVLLVPAGLLLALSFYSGGFFPDAVAMATVALLGMFAVRTLASPEPFAGLRPAFSLVASALIGFTAWTQASGAWSGSPAKSTFEYDR